MFAMAPRCNELDPKVDPSLLVPIQVIWLEPSAPESQFTSAHMSSLGSWTDSLSAEAANHAPGKFNGIPCEVAQVRQLESHWYAVQFYTNEFWGRRNALDCTGFGR